MHIDKYKKEDGYYDEDDIYYEDSESFLQGKILGFCNCGMPENSLKHVQLALRQVSNLKCIVWEKKQTIEEWDAENNKLLGGETGTYFMWYWLDTKGFTEHGGSVPGWLTESGYKLLEDLDEYFKNQND